VIEWTDRSDWNPVRGCSRVSEGCRNCYAERMLARFSDPGQYAHGFAERTPSGPKWTGKVELQTDRLRVPLRWKKPARVFVNSTSDLFHEALSFEEIDRVFATMALAGRHVFQVLTKRPARAREYLEARAKSAQPWKDAARKIGYSLEYDDDFGPPISLVRFPLPNVWLGVSVEDRATAVERIPELLKTPAALRWVSAEPLLEPIDFRRVPNTSPPAPGCPNGSPSARVDWIVVGGESGPGARACDVAWIRSVVAQARGARVPVFVKQLGAAAFGSDAGGAQVLAGRSFHGFRSTSPDVRRLRNLKGADPEEWPEDLRVREFPR
jgi:protein gp37